MFSGDDFVVINATSPLAGMQPSTSDRVMFTGTKPTGTMISRVEALYARLDKIREDSSEMSADEKRSYYARLNEINDKQTGLTAQLDALKSASVGSYDELKRDIEERILEIEQLLIQMRQL